MTSAEDLRPLVCGTDVLLPLALLVAAPGLEAAGTAGLDDVMEHPLCQLQARHVTPHYATVMELDGPTTGAVWVRWADDADVRLVVLPDCPVSHPSGSEGCGMFSGHPGGHTWELRDPLQEAARQVLAALPMFRIQPG